MRRALVHLVWCAAFSGACKYDIDAIYTHRTRAADAGADAGSDAGQMAELPARLSDLWAESDVVDADCRACAARECAAENTLCRSDEECAALTRCVAGSMDPDTHAGCREQRTAWLSEDIRARSMNGPYYACVFRDGCPAECASHTDYSCLGQFSRRLTSKRTVNLRLRLIDALMGQPSVGVTVKACRQDDLTCSDVAAMTTTDENGVLSIDLPVALRAFRGYLELTGGGIFPTLLHFGWPLGRDDVMEVRVVAESNVENLIDISGVALDGSRGLLQIRAFGCAGVGMEGVSMATDKADADSRTWYATSNNLPDFMRTETTTVGSAGIINVPGGLNRISARLAASGALVSETDAPVRADFMTIVVLSPLDSTQAM
jgi:hypothetical protein